MIIADENIDNNIIIALRGEGVDVFSIAEIKRGIDDREVVEIAKQKKGIILTEVKILEN